jgi:hypothetical protein
MRAPHLRYVPRRFPLMAFGIAVTFVVDAECFSLPWIDHRSAGPSRAEACMTCARQMMQTIEFSNCEEARGAGVRAAYKLGRRGLWDLKNSRAQRRACSASVCRG